MTQTRVAVLDDKQNRAQAFQRKIADAAEKAGANVRAEAPVLENILGAVNDPKDIASAIDYDVVLIDYDIRGSLHGQTGEALSYKLRCFSQCKQILVVNQNDTFFDLCPSPDLQRKADYYLGEQDLRYSGLWSSKQGEGEFRPWIWPNLMQKASDFTRCMKDLRSNPNQTIPDLLGFGGKTRLLIPTVYLDPLEKLGIRIEEDSVLEIGRKSLFPHDARKSDKISEETRLRLAQATIAAWLERCLLENGQVLLDLPHLVERYPSLVKNPESIQNWNKCCNLDPTISLKAISDGKIAKARLGPKHWLSRPAYWAEHIQTLDLPDDQRPQDFPPPSWVFVENMSCFKQKARNIRQYRADGSLGAVARFVNTAIPDAPEVRPYSRIAPVNRND